MLHFSGQHQRSLSDVEEDATVPEGVEHGTWDINTPYFTLFIFVPFFSYYVGEKKNIYHVLSYLPEL